MKITSKHKVKDLSKFAFLLDHSDTDLMKEVGKFDLPEKIGRYPVKDFNEISIEDMIIIWGISTPEQLTENSARIFLRVANQKIVSCLPLIDFLRLNIHLEKVSKTVANEFKKLSREHPDPKIRKILEKYKGSAFDMIDRFRKLYPAYKIDEIKKLSWNDFLQAFQSDTKSNDIQIEVNGL